ncbi:MAG: serine/threonine-protein kinase [bacterium]
MPGLFPQSAKLPAPVLIGSGGFADVYQSEHPRWGQVAVKLAREYNLATIDQFKREYKILRSLKHPGICHAYDLGWCEDGRPFLVMQHLPGGELYENTDRLAPSDRFQLLGMLLDAVDYLHHLGIVHRDLKGENILLDNQRCPVVTDLGLALAGQDQRRSGTLAYMAPEIIDNREATSAADVYSLGVMLYRIAAGRMPFDAADPASLISQKSNPDFNGLPLLPSELPQRLRDTVERCLAPEPEERFRSAGQIAEQLRLAGLLTAKTGAAADFRSHWHHHLRAYNTSWVRQNLTDLQHDCQIVDHHQAEHSDLTEVVVDFLKLAELEVQAGDGGIRYAQRGTDNWHRVHFSTPVRPGSPAPILDYPELDYSAVKVLLEKTFSGGIDPEAADLLFSQTDGNLSLLLLLLESLQHEGCMRSALSGPRLELPAPAEVTLPAAYFAAVEKFAPEIPTELETLVSFLAAEKLPYDLKQLVGQGMIEARQVATLTELGLLNDDEGGFRSSYLREYYYHRAITQSKNTVHRRWLELLEREPKSSELQIEQRRFEHLLALQESDATVEVALSLTQKLWRSNQPVAARRVIARTLRLPNLERLGETYLRLLMRSADLAKDAGDLAAAISQYAHLVRQASRQQAREILAESYKDLGDLYKARCDYRRGLRVLNHAIELYRELDDELEISHCLNNIGNLYWLSGELHEAADHYKSALEIQQRLDVKRDVASSLSNLGSVLCVQQQFDEGIPLQREAIALSREIDELGQAARTANNLSVSYLWIDQLQLAREQLDQSIEINRSLGAEKELLFNYENLGEVSINLGDFDAAREALLTGLEFAPADYYSHRCALVLKLAEINLLICKYGKAEALLRSASRYEQLVTDSLLSADLALTRCRLALMLKRFNEAGEHLNRAFEFIDKLGDNKKKANLMLLAARWQVETKAPAESVEARFVEIEELLSPLPVQREWLLFHLDRAEFELRRANLDSAAQALRQAAQRPEFDGRWLLESRRDYLSALLSLAANRPSEALGSLARAYEGAAASNNHELIWRIQAAQGEALLQQSSYERALKNYIAAFDTLRTLAGGITRKAVRQSYLSDPEKSRIAEKLEELRAIAV